MKNLWRLYKNRVTGNCLEGYAPSDGIYYWRNFLFSNTIIYMGPIFLVLFIPAFWLAVVSDLTVLAVNHVACLFALLFIAFKKNVHVFYRKILFFIFGYILITLLLFFKGPIGPALVFMLAISIFALLFIDKKAGYITLVINTLLCAVFELLLLTDSFPEVTGFEPFPYSWTLVSANFLAVNLIMVWLISTLLDGLYETINSQKILEQKLNNQQQNLQKSVELLRSKSKDLELANERYVAVTNLMNEAVWHWDMSTDNRHWGAKEEAFFGYNLNDELDTLKAWSDKLHPDHADETVDSLLKSIHSDKTFWECEYLFKSKSGNYVNILERAMISRSSDGSPIQMLGVMQDITEFKNTEAAIREALNEKETLLAEIHHRVKNNLAVVSGLLELQSLQANDDELSKQLLDSTIRIKSMAGIHEQLYQSKQFSHINLGESLEQLINTIVKSYQIKTELALDFEYDEVFLNINKTVPCSLIINEVITNILKHAFKNIPKGMVKTSVENKNGEIKIKITDNGNGLPDDFGSESKKNMGLFLIETLSSQLEGTYVYRSDGKGTTFELTFSNEKES